MKTFLIVLLSLFSFSIFSQELYVHEMIGRKKSDVIKLYGNPVHQDNSNSSMVCMFYQSQKEKYIFVSDNNGVYQAEATNTFETEKDARAQIDKLIAASIQKGYSADTVSVNDFNLHKPGVKSGVQLFENKLSKKYDIIIKANRTAE